MLTYRYRLKMTAEPETEPLTLDEARKHLRLDTNDDDALLRALIETVRSTCEVFTGRALINRGYSLFLDQWPSVSADKSSLSSGQGIYLPAIELPRPPLVSIGQILTYNDADVSTVFSSSNYYTDANTAGGRVVLRNGSVPTPERTADGIEIQFTAGYGINPTSIPAPLTQGMKQMLAALYEGRGDTPGDAMRESGAHHLWQPFRIMGGL